MDSQITMKPDQRLSLRPIVPTLLLLALLGVLLCNTATAQTAPQWKVHDPARPHPPVVTPAPQDNPVPPPSDAIVLFNGKDLSEWCGEEGDPAPWKLVDGFMTPPGTGHDLFTKRSFGDIQLHVEWSAPLPARGSGQGCGNSGIFFMGLYEIQILDSFENETYADGQAASLYGQHPPLVNACLPPGEWQTYDILFRHPRFHPDGTLAGPARLTAFHNGILVQDDVEFQGPTTWLQVMPYTFHPDRLPLSIQDHGNPVRFRNIWVRELAETRQPGPEQPERLLPTVSLTAKALEGYVGCFKSNPNSRSSYDVFSDGSQLHILYGRERSRVDLVANSPEKFSFRWTAGHVEFALDENGKAQAITLHVPGALFTVKRVEK